MEGEDRCGRCERGKRHANNDHVRTCKLQPRTPTGVGVRACKLQVRTWCQVRPCKLQPRTPTGVGVRGCKLQVRTWVPFGWFPTLLTFIRLHSPPAHIIYTTTLPIFIAHRPLRQSSHIAHLFRCPPASPQMLTYRSRIAQVIVKESFVHLPAMPGQSKLARTFDHT